MKTKLCVECGTRSHQRKIYLGCFLHLSFNGVVLKRLSAGRVVRFSLWTSHSGKLASLPSHLPYLVRMQEDMVSEAISKCLDMYGYRA
jgi:hypothetical protein